LVDGPEVVVLVEADRVRVGPGVEPLADLAQELACLVEEQDLRGGGAVGGAARAVRSREHRDLALGVHGDAGGFAEIHVGGELEEVRHRVERDFGNRRLRDGRGAEQGNEGDDDPFHGGLLWRKTRPVWCPANAGIKGYPRDRWASASASSSGSVWLSERHASVMLWP